MSRASNILEGIVSGTLGFAKAHQAPLAIGGTAAGIGVQAALARKQRNKKIKDAGHGEKLQRAKDRVTVARVKNVKALGLSKKRRDAVKTAKSSRQKAVNKGLHAFGQKVAAED
jgi:hypothetical protein